MEQTLEYLTQCGVFFVASADGTGPHVYPVALAGWYDGSLYILVDKDLPLYRQLRRHPAAEIAAVHPDKSWISIRGRLEEDLRPEAAEALKKGKREMLTALPGTGGDFAAFRLCGGRAAVRSGMDEVRQWTVP